MQGLAAVAIAGSLGACDLEPCGKIDLTGTQTRSLARQGPTVIAVSDGAHVEVVRTCAHADCGFAELEVQSLTLRAPPDQLMLTASGRWLTYRVGSGAFRIDLDAPKLDTSASGPQIAPDFGVPGNIDEIVGSLRGGDWLIYRSRAMGGKTGPEPDSELWAVYVGELSEAETAQQFQLGAGHDLRVVAMGHRHIVARERLDEGREDLYLVRVAPARRVDILAGGEVGDPLHLTSGDEFRRVMITEGPSPAQIDGSTEPHAEVPTDVQVIATTGAGAGARTLVFAVSDLDHVANFSGEVVTSLNALEDVPGLSPVSPGGKHLAYITTRGDLALRNLDDQKSCMIRPASATRHVLAGFASDGTMYFEAEEGGHEAVYAYQGDTQVFTPLTGSDQQWRLQAVPPRRYELDQDDHPPLPWAVVRGDYDLSARGPGSGPKNLSYERASFLPRGDETLWLLEANDKGSHLDLRRIQPVASGTTLGFDTDADPIVCADDGCKSPQPYSHAYSSPATTVCVSVSQSAIDTTPWATQCSEPSKPKRYLDSGPPAGELGP
ncbi:hypothetical protein DB30_01648 [Enhygromyxa salina]|uniref:Uncharacterized protein n=1 Tax=Enhygromyxa salina TaxID=215803 RepID=A0A0C1ZKU0_9BACT|nr:hypothetical protein DB30_01648 [Enhygromyxa salina]